MKGSVIFLRGTYASKWLPYYQRLCGGKFTVAANGGCAFFRRSGLSPDAIIGDLDSAGSMARVTTSHTEVVRYSSDKNKTDAELAIEYCLGKRFRSIDLVMPTMGEPDHFMGAMLLLLGKTARLHPANRPKLRIINHRFECLPLVNCSVSIKQGAGDRLSIVPVSRRILLSCVGTEYEPRKLAVRLGDSTALRNKIVTNKARISVTGTALVIRQFAR